MKVNKDTEDEFDVFGYRKNNARTTIFIILCVLTGGILWLLARWYPEKQTRFTHNACKLTQADIVVIHAVDKQVYVQQVKEVSLQQHIESEITTTPLDNFNNESVPFEENLIRSGKLYFFEHLFLRYSIADDNDGTVSELSGYDNILTTVDVERLSGHGITQTTSQLRHLIYDVNHIEVPVRSFLVYALQVAANPFYVFQVCSFTIWFAEGYVYYPIVIIFISISSITLTAYQTMSQMKKLRKMVDNPYMVKCLDEHNSVVEKSSLHLVPGDVLLIPSDGLPMPCDAVLLEGACVVNESSLTGESFPVSKKPLDMPPNTLYQLEKFKVHTLQYGTNIIQARGGSITGSTNSDDKEQQSYVRSLVVRTGFCTLKGRLIRTIIHPKAIKFQAYREAYKFLAFLGILGIAGMIFTLVVLSREGNITALELIISSLSVITIIVPPGLPACLSAGVVFALRKLRKGRIFCIDSQRINVCGDLDLFVFDKTGTLTEDHLNVKGVYDFKNGLLQLVQKKQDVIEDHLLVKGLSL